MPSYLYYRRGDEWVRVNADAFTTQTDRPANGYCSGTFYIVEAVGQAIYRPGVSGETIYTCYWRSSTLQQSAAVIGPVGEIVTPFVQVGGLSGFGPPLQIRDGTPNIKGMSAYDNSFGRNRLFQSGNNRTLSATITKITPNGGLDNCPPPPGSPSGCTTIFTLNGAETLRINTCPEITDGRGCTDCCSEVLPLIRSIRI